MPKQSNKKKSGRSGRGRRGGRQASGQQENRGPVFPSGRSATWALAHRIGGVPQTLRTTLNYANSGTLTVPLVTYAENVAILNGPYDPDAALGGESATGFAKLMAFYSKCFVIRARWRVNVSNTGSSSNLPPADSNLIVGATVSTNSSSLSGVTQAITTGISQYNMIAANPDTCQFEGVVDIGAFVNKPQVLDDPDFFCTSSSNPSQVICLHTWAESTGAAGYMPYLVLVEFDCVFTDPIPFS